jgi:hypothetical protein
MENEKYPAKHIVDLTKSFSVFLQELQRSDMLISYLEVGSKFIAENNNDAKAYLKSIYDHVGNPENAKKAVNDNLDKYLDMNFYEIHLSSMIYVNSVDNFTTYFKNILSEVVLKKPQVLKSQDSEKLDFILEHESMDDLINAIANKKIEELFYKGIEDIEKFFKNRLGIEIFKTDNGREIINLFVKQRNLTVHNRRKISKEFAKQFPKLDYKIGEHLNFDFKYVSSLNLHLFNLVASIDEEISQKFKLTKMIAQV